MLRNRFASGAGAATSLASFDARLTAMGFSTVVGQSATTMNPTAADLGKRIGQAIITWGAGDGFPNPPAYTNYNTAYPLNVMGTNGNFQANMPLGFGIPPQTDPNLWQQLALASSVAQNGIPIPGGIQGYVGVQVLGSHLSA